MQIIDIIIILMIGLGAILGFKEGAIKKGTAVVGLILVVILSLILKNPLSVVLYNNLPFYNFFGKFKDLTVLTILLYEVLSFMIVAVVLFIVLRILLIVTGIIEKILKATIILSIPSKILGLFIGAVQAYIYLFIALFILTIPVFNISIVRESDLANKILNNSPTLSSLSKETMNIYTDVYEVLDKYNGKDSETGNKKLLDVFLKDKFITVENAEALIEKNKIPASCKEIVNKYK